MGDNGKWQITPSKPLKAGDVIKAFQTDKDGVASPTVQVKVQKKKTGATGAGAGAALVANKQPVVAANIEGSYTITGTGKPQAIITVTLPDGRQKTATVNPDGNWQVTSDKPLVADEIIKVSAWIQGGTHTAQVMSKVLPAYQGQ